MKQKKPARRHRKAVPGGCEEVLFPGVLIVLEAMNMRHDGERPTVVNQLPPRPGEAPATVS
jgi:hypothetical protein